MKTAIVYYSQHRENTKKLVDAIKTADPQVKLINIGESRISELNEYDYIGIASGICFGKFAKPLMEYLKEKLPTGKDVFALYTCGIKSEKYSKELKNFLQQKECIYHGEYCCLGYVTFGPFKLVGGLSKDHPDDEEIRGAVDFYRKLTGV